MRKIEILSPYGKDVQDELSRIYGIQSLEELQTRVKTALHETYGLTVIAIEWLHIALCMCMRLQTDQGIHYLKFIGKGVTQAPVDDMLHYIAYLRSHGLPLPEIIPTKSNRNYFAMLPDSSYNATILMTPVKGHPIPCDNTTQIQNYATALAEFHQFGNRYISKYGVFKNVSATPLPFAKHIQKELPEFLEEGLRRHAPILNTAEQSILKQAHRHLHQWCIQEAPHLLLEKTHIHGDIRMCHVFQENNAISGIIDFDQTCYAERLIDICFGVVSAPTQNDGKALDVTGQQLFLKTYHKSHPLTEDEQEALHPFLLWANLEQFWDLCDYHSDDPEHVTREKLRNNIEEIERLMHDDLFKL